MSPTDSQDPRQHPPHHMPPSTTTMSPAQISMPGPPMHPAQQQHVNMRPLPGAVPHYPPQQHDPYGTYPPPPQQHQPTPVSPGLPKKRRYSETDESPSIPAPGSATSGQFPESSGMTPAASSEQRQSDQQAQASTPASATKKSRTNTPWTQAEEAKLKTMRDSNLSWSEIAKSFPSRTEGSVKKHWYKDMHYAEFAQDESEKLLQAIKEYDANKWKYIGSKLGKPAKACEAYAKENFGGRI